MMLRDSKYATSEPIIHSNNGIQVFKQHHLPSFSRVTEKAEEEDQGFDEEDSAASINQKWSDL